ncbi:hypothetical protein AB1Y20_014625 [Prymnesium parvum]|uniref:Uncharacterized protein n=1 Tax=Prymnesium parvum TaxID=97485 RepID=A0AB34IDE1_PRYPA|mmetsp:Transcript_11363/g.28092  ORF Transcript_11363/g.28092 Transcript_11363/m.28092 type:complete len:489 (-) Transcript_11363:413-1879(-)
MSKVATRPGTSRVLDASIASQLLARGESVDPAPAPGLKHLHQLVHIMAGGQAAASNVDMSEDSENGILSDPEETLAQEERLEKRVEMLRAKYGLSHDKTLKQIFKLLDCLIGQYKLNRTEKLLEEVQEVCQSAGSDWRVKHIQSLAFCRWKQYRFKEALALFLEQQAIVGASAALCENIGHTYSSLGDLPSAEQYFERAIELLKVGSYGNKGGIYMGLGLVRDRMGKTKEALPILEQALDHYQKEHTKDHQQLDSSIIAKAHMSIGKAHEKLEDLKQAASHMAEALRIFRRTVGETSPLTAHALGSLGKVRSLMGPEHLKEAISLLRQALKLEIAKDAFHLETVWDLFTRLKDVHMGEARERQQREQSTDQGSHLITLKAIYARYLPLVAQARARITSQHERDDIGTLAVFYKAVGELCMLAQDYNQGEELLNEALRLFALVPNFDCSGLIEGCKVLLSIAQSNQQSRPKLVRPGCMQVGDNATMTAN